MGLLLSQNRLTLTLPGLGAKLGRETTLADRTFSQNKLFLRPNHAAGVRPMELGSAAR
jgi:hypothetical protein